jgi:hypothetical protein
MPLAADPDGRGLLAVTESPLYTSWITHVLEQTSELGSLPLGMETERPTIGFCPVLVTVSERMPLPFPEGIERSPAIVAWSDWEDELLVVLPEDVVDEDELEALLVDCEVDELEVVLLLVEVVLLLLLLLVEELDVGPPVTVTVVTTRVVTVDVTVTPPEEFRRPLISRLWDATTLLRDEIFASEEALAVAVSYIRAAPATKISSIPMAITIVRLCIVWAEPCIGQRS